MTDQKLIKLENKIQKKLAIEDTKKPQSAKKFNLEKAKALAEKLNKIDTNTTHVVAHWGF